MASDKTGRQRQFGRLEYQALRLVFGGPVSTWVSVASLAGVRVQVDNSHDERFYAQAEAQVREAERRFWMALPVALVFVIVLLVVLPPQWVQIRPLFFFAFDFIALNLTAARLPWWIAEGCASVTVLSLGSIIGLVNALVFGGIPLYLLRQCALAAAPAVSVALSRKSGQASDDFDVTYPRLAFAVETVLSSPRRGRHKDAPSTNPPSPRRPDVPLVTEAK